MKDKIKDKYSDIGMITVKHYPNLTTKEFLKAVTRGFLAFGCILALLLMAEYLAVVLW